jgi:hypothetical protein
MQKLHVTLVAILVAGAAVLGAVAVTRTTGLGSATRHANDAAVASRTKRLAAYAARLRQELKAKPPALPRVPKQRPTSVGGSQAPRIVYHQPPPVVVTIHKHHGDDGSEAADGGGGGDG